MIGEGDKVVAMIRMTGVHKAEFMGIAPSGRTINVGGRTSSASKTAKWSSIGACWTRAH